MVGFAHLRRPLSQSSLNLQAEVSLATGSPPPAYVPSLLESYLQVFSRYASRNLQIGIKLPPYTYEEQLVSVVRTIAKVSMAVPGSEPIVSFLTSTNTLGQGKPSRTWDGADPS